MTPFDGVPQRACEGGPLYRVFSRDVTTAMLVSLNKGTAAILVSQSNPSGIELYSFVNVFFCFG